MEDISLVERTLNWMQRKQYRSRSRGTYWASEASVKIRNEYGETEVLGKCMRAVFYRLKGVEQTNPPGPKAQMLFLLGNMIEDQLTEMWKQMGIWENNSVRWEDMDHNLSGEYDVILKEQERLYGVECKSFYGYHANKEILGHWSGRGSNKRFIYGKPKEPHLMQAAIYAANTRNDLEGFKLVYASRDNNVMQEFNITVNEGGTIFINSRPETRFTMNDIYERYAELQRHDETNTLPARDFVYTPSDERVQEMFERGEISNSAYKKHTDGKERYTDFHCSYCNYKDHCHGERSDFFPQVDSRQQEQESTPEHMLHGGL